MEKFESYCEQETYDFARALGEKAVAGEVYCLFGELGAGKTVFAKGFAAGLGVSAEVTSPTFSLVNEYIGRLPFYHFDVYRIHSPEEMDDTGSEDFFYGNGVCLVEWAGLISGLIPKNAYYVKINRNTGKGENYRSITIEGGL